MPRIPVSIWADSANFWRSKFLQKQAAGQKLHSRLESSRSKGLTFMNGGLSPLSTYPNKVSRNPMVLLQRCCCHGAAATVLLPRCCCHGAAATVLLPGVREELKLLHLRPKGSLQAWVGGKGSAGWA
jgi:hypothetical protein